jgi:hypothetical protein
LNKKTSALIIVVIIIATLVFVSQSKSMIPINPIVYTDKPSYSLGEKITVYALIVQPYTMSSGCYGINIFDSSNLKLQEDYYYCADPAVELNPYTIHSKSWDQMVIQNQSSNPDEYQRVQVEPGKYTLEFFGRKISVNIKPGDSLLQKDSEEIIPPSTIQENVQKGKNNFVVSVNSNGEISAFMADDPQILLDGVYATSLGGPQSIAAGDLNGDGNDDVVISRGSGEKDDKVAVMLGDSHGKFGRPEIFSVEDSSRGTQARAVAITIADLNGDKKNDIISANSISKSVSVLLNTTPDGASSMSFDTPKEFQVSPATSPSDEPVAVVAGDINNDGKIDVVTANQNSDKIKVILGNGDGTFSSRMEFSVGAGERTGPSDLGVADFNGDGYLDVVTANSISNEVMIFFHKGTSGLYGDNTRRFVFDDGAFPSRLVIADLDANGLSDIITANTGAGNIAVLLGNENGNFDVDYLDTGEGTIPVSIAIGNLDGKTMDIVTANGNSGTISVLFGSGNGDFSPPIVVSAGEKNVPLDLAFVNFNP